MFFLGGGSKKTKKCEEDFLELVKMMSCHIFLSLLRAAISLPLDSPSLLRLTPPRSLKNLSRFLKLGLIQTHFVRRWKWQFSLKKARFIWKLANTINSRRFYIFHEHFHVNSVHLKLLRALHVQKQIKYIVYVPLKMFQNIWTSLFPPINL